MSREKDSPSPLPGEGAGAAGASEDKKTETTLTTRVRINIPGSRPIPPVILRETVESSAADSQSPPAPRQAAPPPRPDGGSGPGTPSGAPKGGKGEEKGVSSWFQPSRKGGGEPSAADGPAGGTPAGGVPSAGGAGRTAPTPQGGPPPGGAPGASAPRSGSSGGNAPRPGGSGGGIPPLPRREKAGGQDGFRPPAAPTTGPGTGNIPLPPLPGQEQSKASAPAGPGGSRTAPDPAEEFGGTTMDLGGPLPRPGGDIYGAESGRAGASGAPAPAPPGPPGPRGPATPVGGTPALADPYGQAAPGAENPLGAPAFGAQDGDPEPVDRGSRPTPPPRRGKLRGRLMLAAFALVGVGVLAYGAGLFLDQDEVSAGTTVLGHDIGGGSAQDAVTRLDAALGDAAAEDLTVVVDGAEVPLKPSVAGLSLDTEATVAAVSGTDYNPVAVIGSLAGGSVAAEPVFAVDEEKLQSALADLSSGLDGEPQDGSVSLDGGVPTAEYGTPGIAVDTETAGPAVREAFEQRVRTGADEPVQLDVATVEPAVDDAEVDRAMAEFAEPAMSGLVTVVAGDREIQFSPENSLHLFLSMRPTDEGRLVEHYDLEALEALYGASFDGVEVVRGDGSSTPVSPHDVVVAMGPVLLETDPAARVAEIALDPN